MANSNNPNEKHTLDEFIATGKASSTVTYYATSVLDGNNGIHYSIANVVFDYIDEIKSLKEPVSLTPEQAKLYMYDGVYTLSYDVYGTRDLAYLIMALNGIYNPMDFTMNPVYMIRKTYLLPILEDIYNAEREYLNFNRSEIGVNR